MPEYFFCNSRAPLEAIPWNINEDGGAEGDYFGKVFAAMERNLEEKDLIFYLTWSVEGLPSYGANVVACVVGDEECRIPKYSHRVRAVFKCYGTRPTLGCNPLRNPSYLNLLTLAQYTKTMVGRLPGLLAYKLKTPPNIYDVPLGYYNQLNLPLRKMELRATDIFFAGNMVFKSYPFWSFRYWLESPKSVARRLMVSSLRRVQKKHPHLKIDLLVTPNFGSAGSMDAQDYSEKMMDTKICLVPRGSSFETYRFYEALRYGCIIICEALPSRWFYDSAPVIKLADWGELEAKLDRLVHDSSLIAELHGDSLKWWEDRCSERAVGDYIARKLNDTRQSRVVGAEQTMAACNL